VVSSVAENERRFHRYPIWAPRYWGGMTVSGWWGLLSRNRFAVHPSRMPWAILISAVVPFNSLLALLQCILFSRKINKTQLCGPPVFVIGHWRSGTTYLQELLSLDPRHAAPTTLQTYAANHFLVSQWFVTRFLSWMLPARRPMDNVEISWNSPQEDEWAMSTMGLPAPYQKIAFPCNSPPALDYLDMDSLSPAELDRWSAALVSFFKAVTLKTGRQLILKSPHHTGRIHVLSRLFPDARFVHISRDPYTLLPSTVRMYRAFEETQSLQVPPQEGLERYVLETGERVYHSYFRHRGELPNNRLCEVTFEELTQDSVGTMEKIYRQLELGDFGVARPAVEEYAGRRENYQKNRYLFPAEWKSEIQTHWKDYFDHFGYPRQTE